MNAYLGASNGAADEDVGQVTQAACLEFDACFADDFPWSSNIVYYDYDSSYTGSETSAGTDKYNVRAALDQWEQVTGFLDFQEGGGEPLMHFVKGSDSGTSPGSGSIAFTVTLSSVSLNGTANGTASISHEVGHALTLPHEQQMYDRNRYLNMNESRVGTSDGGVCSD